ncbi:hypothetical protein [Bacteroides bouchesdurhonensis]|uniref:hypothetical protein n=1 Tax=Bacteroides bouchesdurhonensis TaxID=1841855 RepID=UPI00097F96A3|nr:hypothetical protein [Bacteroides bouchesdurhonensis]
MDKDFDFDNIGKQIPYRTSDNFFEEVQRKVMEQTGITQRRKRCRLHMIVATTFAAVAVLAGLLFVPSFLPADSPLSDTKVLAIDNVTLSVDPVDNWIKNLSDEELEELVSFSENDIFLN